MGLIPSINGDAMKLAERAVTALERIADALNMTPEVERLRRTVEAANSAGLCLNCCHHQDMHTDKAGCVEEVGDIFCPCPKGMVR